MLKRNLDILRTKQHYISEHSFGRYNAIYDAISIRELITIFISCISMNI